MTFQRAGSFTSGGKVATIAWSSPPVSTHCSGSTPTAWPMSFICAGTSMRAGAQVDADLAGLGDVPEVGDEAVADVGHGGGAESGRRGARVVRRLGAAVGLDEGARASGSRARAPRARRRTSPASR